MFRWSYLYPLPSFAETNYFKRSTKIGTKIWIAGPNKKNTVDLIEFDTETNTTKKHECRIDCVESQVLFMESDGDILYIWVGKERTPGRFMRDLESYTSTLFKVNTSSFEPQKVISLPSNMRPSNCIIADNKIYLVIKNPGCELIEINLLTEEVTRQKLDQLCHKYFSDHFVMFHDEKMHIIEIDKKKSSRTVFRMENDILEELSTDDPGFDPRFVPLGLFLNSMMLNKHQSTLEAFNFETNEWDKYTPEGYLLKNRHAYIDSFCEVNGKLYTIFNTSYPTNNYAILVLEPKPSLSTICLLNLADKLVEKDLIKIEEIKNQLPIPLRMKLVNMLSWRKIEWEKYIYFQELQKELAD